ncbi:MAG: TetR/AcrR family transcriptional regulator [Lachnospiraceae bacterium]|jgi:AcrR family transcriptional regulator|nr:TetR/AcrR family transcriptional regulator [Lachnospiraceae bacterium]
MYKITGLEDIHQVPAKVRQMYMAVLQLFEQGEEAGSIRVSAITEMAGIGKGTAYEYFDSKEEMVACALVYQIQCIFDWLGNMLEEKGSFREQLDFILDEMEVQEERRCCFLRCVHIMTDYSEFSRMIQEKITREEFKPYLPTNVFGRMLRRGVERGELRNDLPLDYLVYCLFSHLVSYLLAVTTKDCFEVNPAKLRPLIYRGILNEIGADSQRQGE